MKKYLILLASLALITTPAFATGWGNNTPRTDVEVEVENEVDIHNSIRNTNHNSNTNHTNVSNANRNNNTAHGGLGVGIGVGGSVGDTTATGGNASVTGGNSSSSAGLIGSGNSSSSAGLIGSGNSNLTDSGNSSLNLTMATTLGGATGGSSDQAQDQSQTQSASANNSGNSFSSTSNFESSDVSTNVDAGDVTVGGDTTIYEQKRQAPAVFAQAGNNTAGCVKDRRVGVSIPGGGLSFGVGSSDKDCLQDNSSSVALLQGDALRAAKLQCSKKSVYTSMAYAYDLDKDGMPARSRGEAVKACLADFQASQAPVIVPAPVVVEKVVYQDRVVEVPAQCVPPQEDNAGYVIIDGERYKNVKKFRSVAQICER